MVFGYFMSQDDDKSDQKVSTKMQNKKNNK